MSMMGAGEIHTLTQDMRAKEGGVSSYREGRRLVFMLFLKPECSDIEKLVGSQRKQIVPLREL